jgi:hypothetical protein
MSSPEPKQSQPARKGARRQMNSGNDDEDPVLKGFESLLAFVLTITIFGASILTTVVTGVSDPADSNPNSRFTKDTVLAFLAISWLLFILALAVTALIQSFLAFEKEKGTTAKRLEDKYGVWGLVASTVLQLLIIGGFVFLSLSILAYVEVVGWFALGFTLAAALGVLILLAVQWL